MGYPVGLGHAQSEFRYVRPFVHGSNLFIYIVYRLYLLKTIYLRVVSSLERWGMGKEGGRGGSGGSSPEEKNLRGRNQITPKHRLHYCR